MYLHTHQKSKYALDKILSKFQQKEFVFRKATKPIVFLCGAKQSTRREYVKLFLSREKKYLVFYAEHVWGRLNAGNHQSALHMEEWLAKLSDIVIIIVESPGTLTELGAFSLSDSLRKKLLPIIDISHRETDSFVVTGPIRWIDKDSKFKPTIWANLDRVLSSSTEINERLIDLPGYFNPKIERIYESPKHFLLFLCDLIAVIGPATKDEILYCLKVIFHKETYADLEYILALAESMDLIQLLKAQEPAEPYYYRDITKGYPSFQESRFYDLPTLRMELQSAVQSINKINNRRELAP